MKRVLAGLALLLSVTALAGQGPTPKEAFAQLKKLVGTWEGAGDDQGKGMKVVYKLTGAGTTLIETQMAGSPMEMVSMYHMDGPDLIMTHYCAAGNQPTMKYKPGKDAKSLDFEFLKGSNMKPTDMHIHAARIRILSEDSLESDWIGYFKGKDAGTTTFKLKRAAK
jgi:hypothetical protein